MMLAHAAALTEARSYLAALADQAPTREDSAGYERVLLDLDHLHRSHLPAIVLAPAHGAHDLLDAAHAAIENLEAHGVDLLALELLLDRLDRLGTMDPARAQHEP